MSHLASVTLNNSVLFYSRPQHLLYHSVLCNIPKQAVQAGMASESCGCTLFRLSKTVILWNIVVVLLKMTLSDQKAFTYEPCTPHRSAKANLL